MTGGALRAIRARLVAADGVTLSEMLVVLVILLIVVTGMATLFVSASKSQVDQTNRVQGQEAARLGLDKLRREIRCASALTTPSGFPASSITITLGTYCPTAGGATTVTWCTKAAPSGGQPYTLWRYTGSDNCSSATPITPPTKWASNLVDKVDAPPISAGKIFDAPVVPAATLTPPFAGRDIGCGDLLLRRHGGARRRCRGSGKGRVEDDRLRDDQQDHRQLVGVHGSDVDSYNVYGWDGSGLRLLKNVTRAPRSSIPGRPTLTATPTTLPSATIKVASTSNFNAGANTIAVGASGPVSCTGITSTSFTGCTGGQGEYEKDTPVRSGSSARPPRVALSVSLALDMTPASTSQRFVLLDTIVLRNSQPN